MYELFYHNFNAIVLSYKEAEEILIEHFGRYDKDEVILIPII